MLETERRLNIKMTDEKHIQITLICQGKTEKATIYFETTETDEYHLKILFGNNNSFEVTDNDCFNCFCRIRDHFPDITFLCKGAKENVYPSRMARDMGGGLVAYQLTIGKHAEQKDLVPIFDFDDENIVSTETQEAFYKAWLSSNRI